ncbi:choline ABC transporter substrate-binding protein [Verminephrobacter aporrectodeae subsp. tuberculatae]|uniref:choline ABC transporter substrate-binding protein n=1 Tax=Verminephrobacter aporrectodeae TaxID=1110389 RepID=UPI002236F573|nr:choline ABC transporter substrate-binding protein [Verminephrobacter aporrectodeae]MCW5222267.1 choline ABC transporter substrate-binding protein [Verminephrobacter aporrectodeae subsp. tuberculatae]MCW5287731.1 choline ABC transporter substrate-binding protein [Verminephrobacter aporrectodeae subsp. tuberculatae]
MPSNAAAAFPGLPALGVSIALLCAPAAWAEDAACKTVRFADVGWSDIAATTGLASVVLEGLGYKPTVTMASVPIAFASIKAKQIDAFLGYWSPSMTPIIEPFVKAGQIRVLERPNLVGAKYTLAVPAYLYEKGLKTFADIAGFRKELDGKLHGIEPGNDGNALMQRMIDKNEYGLGGFRLVESSEAGMLAEVQRAARGSRAIVFLGWEPHPMNVQMKMKYLEGGDAVFGPNFGEAKVFTAIPPSYEARCPNVATLLKNLQFSTDVENAVMLGILEKARPNAAARAYLKKNPALLDGWLQGVKTFSGQDGLPAVAAALRR